MAVINQDLVRRLRHCESQPLEENEQIKSLTNRLYSLAKDHEAELRKEEILRL
jgi:hypothetical protein